MSGKQKKMGSRKRNVQDERKSHEEALNVSHAQILRPGFEQAEKQIDKHVEDVYSSNSEKYAERQIHDNSDRYNEPEKYTLENEMRGKSFIDVASGIGSDAYFQLEEEKEWGSRDEVEVPFKAPDDLAFALKCIPLHIAFNIPEEYFMPEMVQKFKKQASAKYKSISLKVKERASFNTFYGDDNLIIKENLPESSTNGSSSKPIILSAETENLIESLTSCCSLKDVQSQTVKEVNTVDESISNPQHEAKPRSSDDDLAYLLSLSIPSAPTPPVINLESESIDNWLDQLLEERNVN